MADLGGFGGSGAPESVSVPGNVALGLRKRLQILPRTQRVAETTTSHYRGVPKKSIVGESRLLEREVIVLKTVYRLRSRYRPGVLV